MADGVVAPAEAHDPPPCQLGPERIRDGAAGPTSEPEAVGSQIVDELWRRGVTAPFEESDDEVATEFERMEFHRASTAKTGDTARSNRYT